MCNYRSRRRLHRQNWQVCLGPNAISSTRKPRFRSNAHCISHSPLVSLRRRGIGKKSDAPLRRRKDTVKVLALRSRTVSELRGAMEICRNRVPPSPQRLYLPSPPPALPSPRKTPAILRLAIAPAPPPPSPTLRCPRILKKNRLRH